MNFPGIAMLTGRRRVGLDLGTANTLIWTREGGVLLDEPSMVAIETDSGVRRVIAVGHEAKRMLGKTPSTIDVLRPMRDGVIAEVDVAEEMIKFFIRKAVGRHAGLVCRELVVCVPSGATLVDRRAIRDAAVNAGVGNVSLITEPLAAAIGAGLPVTEALGSMVVDIGGGTTEIAVLSLGGLVYGASVRVGGDRMDEAIVNYMRRNHNLLIGDVTAESIKKIHGSALPAKRNSQEPITVRGRDQVLGVPQQINVTRREIAGALVEPLAAIADGIVTALEQTPPELAADILNAGAVLTGGGALLPDLAEYLEGRTGLVFRVADDPLTCVVLGTGAAMENQLFRSVLTRD